ncbi:tail fiber protein, partial [Acinetobacter baumannii]
LLGNTYGGNGRTTFRLPDLRGRVPVGYGQISTGSSPYAMGKYAGVEGVVLTASNLPPHQHQLIADSASSVSAAPGFNYFGQV